jgi:redox-sensitive bicupin YhaK (pirin superfamily)
MSRSTWSRRDAVRALGVLPVAALGACRSEAPERAPSPPPARTREVASIVDAFATRDGAGVKLRRSIGGPKLGMLDPFLLLDEIHSERAEDYVAGFPEHPHRGFETVTYMIDGAMEHRDSLGNHGHLGPGSTQWMTAGHGIVHSEMPKQEDGRMWGFQLWVNLPAKEKLVRPRYQDVAPERIEEIAIDDAHVRLVAGEAAGKLGPVDGIVTAPHMLDVTLPARGRMSHPVPAAHNAFAYVVEGAVLVGDGRTRVAAGQLAVLSAGDLAVFRADDGGRLLLLAARPIGEPVARYGPFVMSTDEELRRAVDDYRSGRLTQGI